jgi:hypothetical protein
VTDGPDPERLLAEALRAQAVSTPLPPPGPLPIEDSSKDEPVVDGPKANEPKADGSKADELKADESPTGAEPGGDARLVELLSGAGHGLLSGRDPGTVNLPYVGVPTDRTGPVGTTRLNPGRPQLAWWWMLLLAIVLGLAAGAVAGVLTLV